MADIHIQRRSGTNAIWWIVGILALVLIVWFAFAWGEDDNPVGVNRPGGAEVPWAAAFAVTGAHDARNSAALALPASAVGHSAPLL